MFGTHAICCSGVVQLGVHVECNSMFESMQLRSRTITLQLMFSPPAPVAGSAVDMTGG